MPTGLGVDSASLHLADIWDFGDWRWFLNGGCIPPACVSTSQELAWWLGAHNFWYRSSDLPGTASSNRTHLDGVVLDHPGAEKGPLRPRWKRRPPQRWTGDLGWDEPGSERSGSLLGVDGRLQRQVSSRTETWASSWVSMWEVNWAGCSAG